jgi:hypothetical protein
VNASTRPTHTPGPWRVKQTGFTYFRDLTILGADWHGEETPIAAALVRNALHPYGRADKARAEIEANAMLIAAAPDLLAALEKAAELAEGAVELLRQLDMESGRVAAECVLRDARAAIAKATGGNAS